ncbi:hypothetical protein QS257_16085 [Terrilactibacillus sp. S3-3]|nr:hypothetical protein QS257_16085 [Terrilactibacillus sp. S3-3]
MAINSIMDRKASLNEVKAAFYEGFEKGLDIQLVPYTLNADQEKKVRELAQSKYQSDEWNYYR